MLYTEMALSLRGLVMSWIRDHLFSDGGGWSGRPGLSERLAQHQKAVIDQIHRIQNLDQMTDDFVAKIVGDSIVQPPVLDFEKMTFDLRTEQIPTALFPYEFFFRDRSGTYPKQVARISIPFTGDQACFRYRASTFGTMPPHGRISGDVIEYDVVFWGHPDDEDRVKREIEENNKQLRTYTGYADDDVKKFNQQLPGIVEAAFRKRLDEFTKQTSFLDGLGIKQKSPAPPPSQSEESANRPAKKQPSRPAQIIQHIQAMYVQQINQTNNNAGDVNNAIQSDEQ